MKNLGALEEVVMRCLWSTATPLNVREVLEELNQGRALAYTTVMTVLDNLHRKGLVRRAKDGRAFRYEPTMTRGQYTAELLGDVLSDAQDHEDRGAALLHFVERLSSAEQVELRAALRQLETEGGKR